MVPLSFRADLPYFVLGEVRVINGEHCALHPTEQTRKFPSQLNNFINAIRLI